MGKRGVLVVVRWEEGCFERPWWVSNAEEIGAWVSLLERLGQERPLKLAVEPTRTYGDALRQAFTEAG